MAKQNNQIFANNKKKKNENPRKYIGAEILCFGKRNPKAKDNRFCVKALKEILCLFVFAKLFPCESVRKQERKKKKRQTLPLAIQEKATVTQLKHH
ncbi:hypothetical protein DOY81_001679 [Sarcophaga bullata]|nr:hypothetical protein DOY81_001679 [Sarcophaga bullata]